ncbi:hypothetical protein MKS83_12910 [Chryseobacterium sp. Y16C]|uniref:hypothetical protein n=1 Tax=Chryseobacterium sp. Y16C TaxID=2920939 RepID=UPI001F0A7B72|nr:hypothetical protein [Chryseobacterium sp. Y16C]UMQ40300.1 hypothetical protein MKS83_12910 [Chryseobacterium sp. Y16C]
MEIFSLRILTIVKVLYFLRISLIVAISIIILFLFFGIENRNHWGEILGGVIIFAAIFFEKDLFNYFKKTIISKAKHPLPLNVLCNIIQLGKPYYFGKNKFDFDEIINDNKLPLTFYHINNKQYPILQFDREKIIFHYQEYSWENLNWKYKIANISGRPKDNVPIIEFEDITSDNTRIKNKIEFEKIKAEENEVILLFIIHDLLFGTKASYYY